MTTRRHFLQATTAASAAASTLSAQTPANDRIQVAAIGFGIMGDRKSVV